MISNWENRYPIKQTHGNTALLVFALSHEEEVKRKPFLNKGNLAFAFNQHSLEVAQRSGLPVFHVDETQQSGSNFAARFSNAIRSVFDAGFDKVITIGNDSPELSVAHVHRAKDLLEKGKTVLGPTNDGGFYLMGLSKADFDYETFLQFSWNTDLLFGELYKSLLTEGKSCDMLEQLHDVDHFATLANLDLQRVSNRQLRKVIQALIRMPRCAVGHAQFATFDLAYSALFNKGSPTPFFAS